MRGDMPVLLLLVTLSLGLMASRDSFGKDAAKTLHGILFFPFEAAANGGGVWHAREENRALRARLVELAAENARLEEAGLENERLRAALEFRPRVGRSALPAEVVGRRGGLAAPLLVVDRGIADGVRRNHPVVTPAGIVGRVVEVAANHCWVMPLIHPECKVSALVRRSRVTGIVEHDRAGGLALTRVPRLADIGPGDVVVSSGLGGVYPAGWPIGEAVSISEEFGGLLAQVRLQSVVDFSRLEEVFILTDPALGPPAPTLPPVEEELGETPEAPSP